MINRREFLSGAAAAAVMRRLADPVAQRAADFVSAYSAEGFHRTATAVDRASADHLLRAVKLAGARGSLEPFELARVDPGEAYLDVDGDRLPGLTMFDAPFTDADGIRGTVGDIGGPDPIGWTHLPPTGEAALRRVREGSSQRAIVVVTDGEHPGLCPINAQYFDEPFGPPVLLLSSIAGAAVADASRRRNTVRIVAQATRTRATAFNVVVDVAGRRSDLAPLCVMTPRSGWHSNAAERGGGLVCWLEVLRAIVAARPTRTTMFVASSGHELGHLGLRHYLRRRAGLAGQAWLWLHFGANIGAAGGRPAALTCSDAAFEDTVARAFPATDLYRVNRVPSDQVRGEAATIREAHGRFISFIGQNAWFHNTGDRWPEAVDADAVARFARASATLATRL